MSIQVAILKILASHGSGRATLASLNRDIAILSASGAEWRARIRRLASRVPAIDIFGAGYVVRDDEGWEITAGGPRFPGSLEAVTQDNLPAMPEPEHASSEAADASEAAASSWSATASRTGFTAPGSALAQCDRSSRRGRCRGAARTCRTDRAAHVNSSGIPGSPFSIARR